MAGQGISEAVPGWCEIEGCSEKFMQFMIAGVVSPYIHFLILNSSLLDESTNYTNLTETKL